MEKNSQNVNSRSSWNKLANTQYKGCMFWLFMKQYPYMKCQCFSATKFLCAMFSKRYYIATDELCTHLFHHCPATEMHRRTFWSNVITLVGRENFVSLYDKNQTVQILDALGGFSSFVMPDQTRTKVVFTVLNFVHKLYSWLLTWPKKLCYKDRVCPIIDINM